MTLHLAPAPRFTTAVLRAFLRLDLDPATCTAAALLPYVLRHGTRALPGLRLLERALEELWGASLGVEVLKVGEAQVLGFRIEVPGDRHLPAGGGLARAARLLADLVLDPDREPAGALRAAAVAQEKETLRRFLEGLVEDRAGYAAERLTRIMCAGERYALFEYGALEDLPALDGAALEARRQALVGGAPLDVYAVGALDPGRAVDDVAAAFARDCPAPTATSAPGPHPPPRPLREERERVAGLAQTRVGIGLRTEVRVGDPGYWAQLVMNGVLGGFPHSRLFRRLREQAGLCYDVGSTLERHKGLLFIGCGVDPAEAGRARDLCLAQVEGLARGELADDELNQTRRAFRQTLRGLLDAPAYLAAVDYTLRLGGREASPLEAADAIDRVGPADVQAAAAGLRADTVFLLEPEARA